LTRQLRKICSTWA